MNWIKLLLGLKKPYEKLFFDREYRALSGVGSRLIISLIIILTLTFAAICFSVGAIQNLEIKMQDPFTNWVDVPLKIRSGITSKNVAEFLKEFDTDSTRASYSVESITKVGVTNVEFYKRTFDPFTQPQDTLVRSQNGQTIDFSGRLFKNVVAKENVIQDFTEGDSLSPNEGQIIIKQELLEKILGYETPMLESPYIFIRSLDDEMIPLFVAGVVKKLPKNISFVCSESFKNVYENIEFSCGDKYIKSNRRGGNQFSILLHEGSPDLEKITQSISKEFSTEDEVTYSLADSININGKNYQWARLQFGYSDEISYGDLLSYIEKKGIEKPFILAANFGSNVDCPGLNKDEVAYLQFNFSNLSYIQSFASKMQDDYGVNLNMREIESKKNFDLVSDLTMAISIILFAFGLLSIILYVNNQLRTHLNSIKSNLGTFKAFGLSNRFLVVLYRKIVFSYLVVGVLFSLIFVFLIDLIESTIMGPAESKFTALSPWLFAAIVSLFIISDLVSKKTIKKILERTPGDLIYNR